MKIKWAGKPRSLRGRLSLTVLLLALPPFLGASWWGFEREKATIEAELHHELASLATSRSRLLEERLAALGRTSHGLAANRDVVECLVGTADSAGRRRALETLTTVQEQHWGISHHWFLTDLSGSIVLSPNHESDAHEGQSIAEGSFFDRALVEQVVTDFSAFEESDHFHQLLLTPVSPEGQTRGILVVEVCIDSEVALISSDSDPAGIQVEILTLDGETIIWDKGQKSRSLRGEGIHTARGSEGKTVVGSFTSPNGGEVLGAYHRSAGRPWLIGVELPQTLAFAELDAARRQLFIMAALGTLLIIVLTHFAVARGLKPLRKMCAVAKYWSLGELFHRMDVDAEDEIGTLASGLNHATESTQKILDEMGSLASSLTELSATLVSLGQSTEVAVGLTREEAAPLADAGSQVASRLEETAKQMTAMTREAREILTRVGEASKVTRTARELALTTNEAMGRLGATSEDVGQVIKLIAAVARQTNLLALNATIEAARAGDAGKGFGVVAGEVKQLATQTSESATVIAQKVNAIQSGVEDSVASIAQIVEVIERNSELVSSGVEMVHNQTELGAEIEVSVSGVAGEGETISEKGAGTLSSADGLGGEAEKISQAAESLSTMAHDLETQLGRFKAH